jgi:hypothetical protein
MRAEYVDDTVVSERPIELIISLIMGLVLMTICFGMIGLCSVLYRASAAVVFIL